MLAHVTDALHQVAGVADVCLVQCTHVPASVTKSVVSRVSGSTGLFGGHRSEEIKSGVSC